MPVSDSTYATWLTKDQAARTIGVTPKTVERLVADGKIQKAYWQPSGKGATRVVYQPDDVARIAQARPGGPLPPFVMPTPPPAPANGHGTSRALATHRQKLEQVLPAGEDLLRALVSAAVQLMSQTSETRPRLAELPAYVALEQAAAYSGLSVARLRKMIRLGTLTAIKDRGWKIRRKDLEAL